MESGRCQQELRSSVSSFCEACSSRSSRTGSGLQGNTACNRISFFNKHAPSASSRPVTTLRHQDRHAGSSHVWHRKQQSSSMEVRGQPNAPTSRTVLKESEPPDNIYRTQAKREQTVLDQNLQPVLISAASPSKQPHLFSSKVFGSTVLQNLLKVLHVLFICWRN